MFGIVKYEIECPITCIVSAQEINLKWVSPFGEQYTLGSQIKTGLTHEIFAQHVSSLWIREEYNCSNCFDELDKKYPRWRLFSGREIMSHISNNTGEFPKASEFIPHFAYIHFNKGVINDIISEKEFNKRGLEDYLELQ